MSYSPRQKTSCATCGKTAGIFTCRGCLENFCLLHTNEHREILEKQMNEIILNHNQLKKILTGQTIEQIHHSLIEQINQWEQQSMDKIKQVANETRQELLLTVQDCTDNLKEKLTQLTQQIIEARHNGEFFENDLKQWTEKLQIIQSSFVEQQKIQIYQEKSSIPFISRISLRDLSYEQSVNDINHQEHFEDYSDVQEKGEYSLGEHLLRFKIEEYQSNSLILFGIISKTIVQDKNSYENTTFHGWGDNNMVYLAGISEKNYNGYKSDFKTGDVFMLNINCNREMISLTNERTNRTYDLEVDITKCPFPWQPNVRFSVHSD